MTIAWLRRVGPLFLVLPGALSCRGPAPTAPASPSPTAQAGRAPAGDEEQCQRGDAEPFLDASRVGAYTFAQGVGPRAEETGVLDDGTSLRIQHTGCEHYVERLAWTLRVERPDPAGGLAWVKRAVVLLRRTPAVERRAKDVALWIEKLEAHAARTPAPSANEIELVQGFSWLSVESQPVPGGVELQLTYDVAL